jgi:hypothetical protein
MRKHREYRQHINVRQVGLRTDRNSECGTPGCGPSRRACSASGALTAADSCALGRGWASQHHVLQTSFTLLFTHS